MGEEVGLRPTALTGSAWSQHPAYDAFWQGQALDKMLAANPSNVPTLWEQGLWDQEDMYGAITQLGGAARPRARPATTFS